MAGTSFDFQAFHDALDVVRRRRNLTWRHVAREADVSPSSITRMAQGSRPDLDTVVSLARFAGLDLDEFTNGPHAGGDALAMASAYLRRDPSLSPDAAAALEQVLRTTYTQLSSSDKRDRRR